MFRQIITQNVTYETLPLALKATLHEQIASRSNSYGSDIERYLDLLAYHYDQTENAGKRRHYLYHAGQAAQDIYANEAGDQPLLSACAAAAGRQRPHACLDAAWPGVGARWTVGRDEAAARYAEALTVTEATGSVEGQTQAQIAIGEIHQNVAILAWRPAGLARPTAQHKRRTTGLAWLRP